MTGRSRFLSFVALAATVAPLIFAVSAWAAPEGPSPFRHDLRRIDSRLRMGIEYAPAELGEGLSVSEGVCRLAEKMEERGDSESANADWSTLSQLVEEVDQPAARRVDGALLRADSGLRALRDKYEEAWPDRSKAPSLHRGVARTREGIRMLRAAIERIAGSFDAWTAHRCQAATDSIEAGLARAPAAVARINSGMQPLWKLAD